MYAMKNQTYLSVFAGCAVALAACSASAAPRGVSNLGREYVINTAMLSPWSLGAYLENLEREVIVDRTVQDLSSSGINGFIGYDVLERMTVFGTYGGYETEIGRGGTSDRKAHYGVGLNVNLIDQPVLDPTLYEDRLRLNLDLHYTFRNADYAFGSLAWNELYASLTLGIVNDISGNKFFLPFSMNLFGGVVYSDLHGDVEERDQFGFTFGLDVFLTKRVQLTGQMIRYDSENMSSQGGVGIRF